MSAAKLLGIGIAVVAAYEVWSKSQSQAVASVPVASTGTTSIAPANTTMTVAPAPVVTDPIWSPLVNINPVDLLKVGAVQSGQLYNVSQWNYLATQLTGVPGQFLGDNGQAMTVYAYLQLIKTVAQSKGLGMIINLEEMYSNQAVASGFGDGEFIRALAGLGRLAGIVDAPELNAAYVDEGPIKLAYTRNGSLDSTTRGFYLGDGF